jgi:hypothetical protein
VSVLAWLLLGYAGVAFAVTVWATWFGWHLRRFRSRHGPPHVHTRALWLVERELLDCSESSGRDTPETHPREVLPPR